MSSEPTLSDEQLLSGLWWGDPEYPPQALSIWQTYVQKMHEWEDYKRSCAQTLRTIMEHTR